MIKDKHKWIIEELKVMKEKGLIQQPRKRASKGYANFPIKWSVEGQFKDYGFKERGVNNKAFASYSLGKNRSGILFIDLKSMSIGKKNELNKVLKDPGYITYRKKMTDSYGAELLNFSMTKLTKENIEKSSKKGLMELYNTFRDIYTRYEFYNGIWFTISDDLQKTILKRLEKDGLTDVDDIQTIMSCPYQSFVNREHIDLLKAAITIKKLGEDFDSSKNKKIFLELKNNYYWMPFLHVGPDLFEEKHYYEELKKILSSNQDLEKDLEKAETYYPKMIKKQKEIIKKYSLDKETVRLLNDIHLLIQMQDERKELISRSHINWVNNLMVKIGSYFGLNGIEAADIFPNEIEKCLLHNIIDLDTYNKDNSTHRKFEITEPDGYTMYFDDDAEPFLQIIESNSGTELKGECASLGYAKGKVKVCLSSDDIGKVNKGDILVTTMTTPDYVPAMRKVAGIITDEGGVTCHAAIVSRELGIPCIINTKNASEILRDGDMIEFDAETGVIKRIENFIIQFSELKNSELSDVGGKALNLGKMFGDFNVPNGFCISAELFRKYVPKDIKERLLLLDLDDTDAVKRFSENVRHEIKKIKFSEEDKEIILSSFDELKSDDVAVRSSGTAEDLPGAAFAGQHDTYLYVKREHIVEKILDCFSSIYSTRAIYYRDMKKISHDVAIAVIIQKMVDSEKSGVMYTKNPNTGVDEVLIEASHGVGEMIVSGKINPDTIKIKDAHIEYKKGSKSVLMNERGIVDNKNSDERCLNNTEIHELLDVAKRLEELFVYPQDIEFAFFRGNLYLLQSRNLTTIKK